MTQQIKTTDVYRARDCVQWLIKNVGPETYVQGSSIRSEGWNLWTQAQVENGKAYDPTYTIEVNDHVDDDTQLLFALKWS
jgi:hypothetical protein